MGNGSECRPDTGNTQHQKALPTSAPQEPPIEGSPQADWASLSQEQQRASHLPALKGPAPQAESGNRAAPRTESKQGLGTNWKPQGLKNQLLHHCSDPSTFAGPGQALSEDRVQGRKLQVCPHSLLGFHVSPSKPRCAFWLAKNQEQNLEGPKIKTIPQW